jgi:hypothetical protein
MRPRNAWIEQSRVIAFLAVSAVLLNWITTSDHLARSLIHRYLWPIADMDLLLLVGGAIATLSAHRLAQRAAGPLAGRTLPAAASEPRATE